MATDALALLTQLANRFSLVVTSPPGEALRPALTLVPPPELAGPDGLRLSFTDLVEGMAERVIAVNLDLVTKGVRYVDKTVTDRGTRGGMPIHTAAADLEGTFDAKTPGYPGVIGAITGSITVPLPTLTPRTTTLEVSAQVRWSVLRDAAGLLAPAVSNPVVPRAAEGIKAAVGTADPQPVPEGEPIAPARSRTPLPLTVEVPLVFTELTVPPPVGRLLVRATVSLHASLPGATEGAPRTPLDTPAVPLQAELTVPVVPVPTLVALFEHPNFSGHTMTVVPPGSPLALPPGTAGAVSVGEALGLLTTALSAVAPQHPLLEFVANPRYAGPLSALRAAPPASHLVAAWTVPDLFQYRYAELLTAEDSMSSFLVIGRRNTSVKLNDERLPTTTSPLVVEIGDELHIAVADLEGDAGDYEAESGGRLAAWRTNTTYGDKLSAVELAVPGPVTPKGRV